MMRLCAPATTARTRCRFGSQRRRVLLLAWLTLLPDCGPLPQTEHSLAIPTPSSNTKFDAETFSIAEERDKMELPMRLPKQPRALTVSLLSSLPLILMLLAGTACKSSRPAGAEVVAEVNGRPIMAKELEQFYQQQVQEQPQKPVGEQ